MLKQNRTKEPGGELRNQFGATLKELAETDDRIMILDADLGGASFFLRFKESHPDRFIDTGICEANMFGVAARALFARIHSICTYNVCIRNAPRP